MLLLVVCYSMASCACVAVVPMSMYSFHCQSPQKGYSRVVCVQRHCYDVGYAVV